MLSTANITMQFGAKPLFENVTAKFVDGNRYGLIGANGCGKSTFMKILGGDLEQSSGEVMLQPGLRMGKLSQNQFGYEDHRVLDVVMMGHVEMWQAMTERDAIYANPEASDDDYMRAAELEAKFAEYGGYDAESRAASLLSSPISTRISPLPLSRRQTSCVCRVPETFSSDATKATPAGSLSKSTGLRFT